MPTFEFFLDSRGLITKEFDIDVTATLPKVTVQVFDGDDAVDLTGAVVTFTLRDAAGAAVVLDAAAVLLNATQGIVEYQLKTADVDDVGFFFAQFKITIGSDFYLVPNDSVQRLRLRIGKEDLPAFSSVPASLPVHAGSHDRGGSDQIALEALFSQDTGIVWVDGERDAVVEGYTADGSFARPFNTVEDGVADSLTGRVLGVDLKHAVVLKPSVYQIPDAKLPIKLTDKISIIGASVETTIIRPEGSGVDKDIFEIDHTGVSFSTYELYNLQILTQVAGRAAVHITRSLARLRVRNCFMLAFAGVSGIHAIKVSHPSGSVAIIGDQINRYSEIIDDFGFTTGIDFAMQDDADCLVFFGCNFSEIKTNANAVTGEIRLSDCRIGHEKISGGNIAQNIFAANCWTDDGDNTIAPLDAQDFRGLHTFKIVG